MNEARPEPGEGPEDWRVLNRELWDVRVPVHVGSRFYDVEGFRAGRDPLRAFEVEEVGDVTGRSLLHLQCHFGQDTLGWARRGARVTGLDFSAAAVAAARALAAEVGLAAEFVVADVYDAPAALGGRTFDVVYTGLGALVWLPDVERWAATVASLLAPGGFLYLAEFHPVTEALRNDELAFGSSYFDRSGRRWVSSETYTDGGADLPERPFWQWVHGLGDVVSALIGAGLRIELLHEHDFTLWARWPGLARGDDGTYRFPAGAPVPPLLYSVRAAAPGVQRGAPGSSM